MPPAVGAASSRWPAWRAHGRRGQGAPMPTRLAVARGPDVSHHACHTRPLHFVRVVFRYRILRWCDVRRELLEDFLRFVDRLRRRGLFTKAGGLVPVWFHERLELPSESRLPVDAEKERVLFDFSTVIVSKAALRVSLASRSSKTKQKQQIWGFVRSCEFGQRGGHQLCRGLCVRVRARLVCLLHSHHTRCNVLPHNPHSHTYPTPPSHPHRARQPPSAIAPGAGRTTARRSRT